MATNNNIFVKEDLIKKLTISTKNLDQLLELINLEPSERQTLEYLFNVMRKLPASITGYHGTYDGGLYDHVLLVANLSLKLTEMIDAKFLSQN